ncbi:MAG TPA: glycosyltransferase [Chloroflexota bacterium]|nr:glycosyltransferase [Chloroflexota bacterium]
MIAPAAPGASGRSGRILFVVSEAPPVTSGIARSTGHLREGMEQAGFDVEVLSLSDVPRVCLGEVRISSMLWRGSRQLLSRATSRDIVHIHGPVPTFSDLSLLFTALGRRTKRGVNRRPLIVYTHHSEIDLPGYGPLCALYNRSHKLLARLADEVIVTTPAYAKEVSQYVPSERVSVVPWGTDEQQAPPEFRKRDRFTVLFVGQIRPYKGLDTLLAAIDGLEDVDLHVVGTGHREHYYRQLAEERGLDHVTFHGWQSDEDVRRWYEQAHVLVLPSKTRAEAFGIVLLEGMVAGCVPVASQLPGVTDVVGNAGLTFPVDDDLALRETLVRLRDDRQLRLRLAERARERGALFTWPRMVFWHKAIYERLLALRRFERALRHTPVHLALRSLMWDSLSTIGVVSASIRISSGGAPAEVVEATVELSDEAQDRASSLAVPIIARGGLLGVLTVSSRADHQFNDFETQWLTSLAQRVGSVLVRHGFSPPGRLPGELNPPPPPDAWMRDEVQPPRSRSVA